MKPTDLWGGFPPSLALEPACRNGDPCHVRAPRGSTTGTQGMAGDRNGYWQKSLVPYPLALAVTLAAERDILSGAAPGPMHVNALAPGAAEPLTLGLLP